MPKKATKKTKKTRKARLRSTIPKSMKLKPMAKMAALPKFLKLNVGVLNVRVDDQQQV